MPRRPVLLQLQVVLIIITTGTIAREYQAPTGCSSPSSFLPPPGLWYASRQLEDRQPDSQKAPSPSTLQQSAQSTRYAAELERIRPSLFLPAVSPELPSFIVSGKARRTLKEGRTRVRPSTNDRNSSPPPLRPRQWLQPTTTSTRKKSWTACCPRKTPWTSMTP